VYNLKTLVVVLGIALMVFAVVKPVCLAFMAEDVFKRRRNLWLTLTVIAFLSPNFWLYAALAFVLLWRAARHDPNPAALFLLTLHVIPPISVEIPTIGINQLFALNQLRILSLVVLLPLAVRLVHNERHAPFNRFTLIDFFVLAYVALQIVLLMPYESITHTGRRSFLLFVDYLLVFYVFSRLGQDRRQVIDAVVCFCLACAIMSPIAVFETVKGWLLYQGLGDQWGVPISFAFLMRGDQLRSQVSAGHALSLGYLLAIGFGLWLYLQRFLRPQVRIVGVVWMWAGLIACYSRGPWLTAVVVFFVFLALGPNAPTRVAKGLLAASVMAFLVVLSPIGDKLIDSLPFIGTLDSANVTYRQQLWDTSLVLIQQNPWLGNPFVLTHMESLRQGQGIIDIVNGYLHVALLYGLVGLALFVAVFVIPLLRGYTLVRRTLDTDPDLAALGGTLIACVLGTLFFIATAGFGSVPFALAGLLASYVQLGSSEEVPAPQEEMAPLATTTRSWSA
jgi:O-antigen ligase